MIQILRLILTQMVLSLRSRAELHVENLALRHQIENLKRTAPKRARLTKTDCLIFTWLLRLWPKTVLWIRLVHPPEFGKSEAVGEVLNLLGNLEEVHPFEV